MSASPSQSRAIRTAGASPVPVARPPDRSQAVMAPVVPEAPPEWDWWTPEAMKGWAGSVALHILLLLVLAFWYFSPPLHSMVTFDSRLAGSLHGVPEGEMFTGGLNTPLPMPVAPLADNELAAASPSLAQLELTPLEPNVMARGAMDVYIEIGGREGGACKVEPIWVSLLAGLSADGKDPAIFNFNRRVWMKLCAVPEPGCCC